MRFALFILLVFCTFSSLTLADDWPQWLGPDRASEWREKGIVEAFPDEGLKGQMAHAGRTRLQWSGGGGRQSVFNGLRAPLWNRLQQSGR